MWWHQSRIGGCGAVGATHVVCVSVCVCVCLCVCVEWGVGVGEKHSFGRIDEPLSLVSLSL